MSTTPDDPSNFPPDVPAGRGPGTGPAPPDPAHPDTPPAGTEHPDVARRKGIKHTRVGATWTGLVIGIIVLVLLLVFILQNLDSVTLELFAWEFTLPLGVTLLFAAIAGAVIMALAGGVRIIQIRRAANRQRRLNSNF
ncbi:lipopolysaccharide assembly LapA domain-containing protein [Rhodococcus sp. NPDC057014]|uniref:LapA family protein n=1 Tax=unclassified Rhodococcus (in: high G+C Gram-positive bacteria) TaxID=192944 RepID=UPI0036303E57